ncbi:hypothetical protein RFI_08883 [Reticulomyxa filosa]|uniref:Phosphoglycerate mutase family protein n=1 Tax=Reticulomyxa filosa TaxID=46433 RepID=X6NRA1_RETFI|nr:hypothetical protein RFI_08883 [Reticulomyxa filosa]|eukprot:ETO28254.1 hypothetical protein RFI_08883 [Reticulomyxa filosa]
MNIRQNEMISKMRTKHVVLNDSTFGVIDDDPDLPLEMEWLLDEMLDYRTSVVTCSNLRRAISTGIIGLWDRFAADDNKELVRILPCLQELGMNVDTHTPVVNDDLPQVSEHEKKTQKLDISLLNDFYTNRLRVEGTSKKSQLFESTEDAKDRMRSFVEWVFTQNDKRTVIAVGHSHWFQHFFKYYLPHGSTHMSGKRKLNNCGVVAFRMCCEVSSDSAEPHYTIKEGSITQIYGTFKSLIAFLWCLFNNANSFVTDIVVEIFFNLLVWS